MSDLLSPHDTWPDHPRPEPRRALDHARQAGWWFKKTTNHAFCSIYCRPPEVDQDHCRMIVFSTSGDRDGHRTAALIRDQVRRCPHRAGAQPDDGELVEVAQVAEAVRNAGYLLEAGLRLLQSEIAERSAERLLMDSEEEPDPAIAEEVLTRAVDAHSDAEAARSESVTYAARANELEPWPRPNGARDLAEDAGRWLEQAEHPLTSNFSDYDQWLHDEYRRIKKGLDSLKVEIEAADQ